MRAIRLSTAIKWDSEEADDSIEHTASLEALRHIESGFIVTPETEALAIMLSTLEHLIGDYKIEMFDEEHEGWIAGIEYTEIGDVIDPDRKYPVECPTCTMGLDLLTQRMVDALSLAHVARRRVAALGDK